MSEQSIAIVIPARMGSSRFPGKPLVSLAGKPMIQWVVEAASSSGLTSQIVVATPDLEIYEACGAFGGKAIMTRLTHVTGTDRIAEVAESLDADIYINVQGDEPLIDPSTIQACAKPLVEDREVQMSSVYCACREDEIDDPAVVKVVTDLNRFALYFSRFAIPFPRNQRQIPLKRHVGIYGYRRDVLQRFSSWPVSPLEATESLEQLRFLENGIRIKLEEGIASETAVDTPAQAELVARILLNRHAIG